MRVKIIINPYANRWRAQRIPAIKTGRSRCRTCHCHHLPGQATEEARLAVEQDLMVVAGGGDGTVNGKYQSWIGLTALPSLWKSARETI